MATRLGLRLRLQTPCVSRRWVSSSPERPDPRVYGFAVRPAQLRTAVPKPQKSSLLANRNVLLYSLAGAVFFVGVTYASVPLYRMFCAQTGYGGTPMTRWSAADGTPTGQFAPERLVTAEGPRVRPITIRFNADCSDTLPWAFKPVQRSVTVRPGETALAFFEAKNKSEKDIIGIATYSVAPAQVAPYFAKIECFCFDEQRLLAGEEVDLPILFFIDRDFADDPLMRDIDDVILSYTFFKAKRNTFGDLVPDPS